MVFKAKELVPCVPHAEVDWFLAMMKKAAPKMGDADLSRALDA